MASEREELERLRELERLEQLEARAAQGNPVMRAPAVSERAELERLRARERAAASEGGVSDDGFSVSEMVGNIPSSAAQFGRDITAPILHPVQTGKALGNLVWGVLTKAYPGVQESEQYADQVGQFLIDRYGSVEAAKQSLESDPVGVVSDVAGLFTGGGLLVGKTAGTAGKVGRVATEAGKAVDPVNVVANTAGYAAGKVIPKAAPRTLYQGAAKFGGKNVDEAALMETALREGIMPTRAGQRKLSETRADVGQEIGDIYKAADAAGVTYPASVVLKHMDDLKQELGGFRPNAAQDLKELDRLIDDFKQHLSDEGITEVTPTQLRQFKTAADNRVKWDRKSPQGSPVREQFNKKMADVVRDMTEEIDPGLRDLNRRYGELAELGKRIDQPARRISNRGFSVGLGPIGAGTGAGIYTGDPLITGAVLAGSALVGHPKTRAKAAIMAEALRNKGLRSFIDNRTAPVLGRQTLLQSGRLQQETSPTAAALRMPYGS